MSAPVLHHQAQGIHRGAFVQPDPPDTAQVQDGVLWVDTSSGPPYRLYLWQASHVYAALDRSAWTPSASASAFGDSPWNATDANPFTRWSSGAEQGPTLWYQIDLGSQLSVARLRLDNTSAYPGDDVPDSYPRAYAVTLSGDGLTFGTAVAVGVGTTPITVIEFASQTARYIRIALTASDPAHWWMIHEVYADSLVPPAWVPVTVQPVVAASAPASTIDGLLWVDTSSGPPYALSVWHAQTATWHAVRAYGVDPAGALIGISELSFPDGAQISSPEPGKMYLDNGSGIFTLDGADVQLEAGHRLEQESVGGSESALQARHRDGFLIWRHDGTTLELGGPAGTATKLPFPGTPTAGQPLVAVSNGSGPLVPGWGAFPALPPTAVSTYVSPVAPTPPPVGATADNVRCGAAHQMAQRLSRLYNIVRAAVGAAIDVGGPLVASALVDIALDFLTGGTLGTWIAANGSSYAAMRLVMSGAITAIENGLLPALDGTALGALTNAAYEALPAGETPIAITQAALDQWATNIANNGASFIGASDTALRLLVATIPLDQWQQEINTGTQYPASDCA